MFRFHETHLPKEKTPFRYAEAFTALFTGLKVPVIRKLALIILAQHFSFVIFYQVILIEMQREFHFSHTHLGLFYSFISLSFALSLTVVLPQAIKRFEVRKILLTLMFSSACFEFLLAGLYNLISIWVVAFFLGMFITIS